MVFRTCLRYQQLAGTATSSSTRVDKVTVGNPAPVFVDGTILAKLPETLEEGFLVRRKEFQYAIDNNLVYGPAMHPWSVYRFDPELKHIEWLIEMAKDNNVPIMNCRQLYDQHITNDQKNNE